MPHLTLELSQGVQVDDMALLSAINQALFDTGHFEVSKDIKSRIHRTDCSLIGFVGDGENFVVGHLAIMAGRDEATKHALVATILKVLQDIVGLDNTGVQYAVDLVELSPYYQKAMT